MKSLGNAWIKVVPRYAPRVPAACHTTCTMYYIAEFTRSKPVAVCMQLNLPKDPLPPTLGPDNSLSNSRNWSKSTSVVSAINATRGKIKQVSQSYCQSQLKELEQALHSVFHTRLPLVMASDPDIDDRLALIQDLCTLGRYADACRYLKQTIGLQGDGNDLLDLADSYRKLAHMQLASGHGDASHNAQTARDIYISKLGRNHPHMFACELILAETALHQEDLTVAQDVVSDILDRAVASQTPPPLVEARALHLQALITGIQGKLSHALDNVQKASTCIQDNVDDPLLRPKYRMLEAILYRKMDQWDEAHTCFDQVHTQLRTLLPDKHRDMGHLILEKGRFYMLQGDLERAANLLKEAKDTFILEHTKLERLIAATCLARLYRIGGHFKDAARMIRHGREAGDKLHAANAKWQFRMELEYAHILLLDGEYVEAVSHLQDLLRDRSQLMTSSRQGELYLLLGQAQWQQHNLDAATDSLQQALCSLRHPMQVAEDLHLRTRVLLDLTELWIMKQDPVNALQTVQEAQRNLDLHTLEQEWLTGRSAYLQGRIAMMTEDYLQAQSHFGQARAHLKSNTEPRDNNLPASCKLWLAHSLLKSDSTADWWLRNTLTLSSRARSLPKSTRIAEVVTILQPMVDSREDKHLKEEDRIQVHYFLALARCAEGSIDIAFKHGQRAYKDLGKLPDRHRPHAEEYNIGQFMGRLYLEKCQYPAAIRVLHALQEDMNERALAPVSAIHDLLAQAYLRLNQLAEAEDHWRQCLAIYQQSPAPTSVQHIYQVRAWLADVLERQGQLDQALCQYMFLDQHSPTSPTSLKIAHLQYRLGHLDPAQERLEQLVQSPARLQDVNLEPLNVFLLLSQVHKERQQFDDARTVLQDALARFGNQSSDGVVAEVNQILAELMEQQGDLAAAITYWQQALTRHETQGETESIWQCLQKLFRLSLKYKQYEASFRYGNAALKLTTAHSALFKNKKTCIIHLCLDLGENYATHGKLNEAFRCYKKGIDVADVTNQEHVCLAAQCHLAKAKLLTPSASAAAEQQHQQIQNLYKRKEIQPDDVLAQSHMQYGLLLWDRNELETALWAMSSAYDAAQHVTAQADHASIISDSQLISMTLQYQILLYADLRQLEKALNLLKKLQPLMQGLSRKDRPISLTTVQEQVHLLGGLPA